jgi:hypothetical protein
MAGLDPAIHVFVRHKAEYDNEGPLIPVHLEGGDEGFLRDIDPAEAPHLFLSRLLLL